MLTSEDRETLFRLQDERNEFESLIQRLYEQTVLLGETVIDGGAHMGMHTIPLAKRVGPKGRVLAFEPIPEIAQSLKSEVRAYPQVEVFTAALAERDGSQSFTQVTDDPCLSSLRQRELGGNHSTKTFVVEGVALGRFSEGAVSFIKLDLEGGEYHALLGGEELLRKQRPIIILECGRIDGAKPYGYSSDDFFALFDRCWYKLVDLFGEPFTPESFAETWDSHKVPHYIAATPSGTQDMIARRLLDGVLMSLGRSS